ncbi:hypothetical protein NKDENANG_02371 [Candidatus Entotheonellaceae bacterium PAL068K]
MLQWRSDESPRASDFILIFLSQHSVAKQGYVQREFKLALDTLEEGREARGHDSYHPAMVECMRRAKVIPGTTLGQSL